jgi:hypothetical protein
MGRILVHEFGTLDGVIDAPSWSFDFGFDPRMGEAIAALTARAGGILLAPPLTLSLAACEQYANGVIHLGYAPSPRMG